MFNRVRWRLTAWYVTVLAVMLAAFGAFLYVGLEEALWREKDADLHAYLSSGRQELHYDSKDLRDRRRGGGDDDRDDDRGDDRGDDRADHGDDDDDRLFAGPSLAAIWLLDDGGHLLGAAGPGALSLQPDQAGLARARAADAGRGHSFTTGGRRYRSYTLAVRLGDGTRAWAQAIQSAEGVHRVLRNTLRLFAWVGAGAVLLAGAAGLVLANRALVPIRAAWQRQRDFASDASHELRTPLAVVQAAADLLHQRLTPSSPESEILADLRGATRRMRDLVDDLLLLARADSGRLELNIAPVDLAAAARAAVEPLRRLAAERHVDLEYVAPEPAWLEGDSRRLEQVVSILAENAIRHHRPPGRVRVEVAPGRERVRLVVSDDGPGIPAAALPHVFDRFYRADAAAAEGTGLGLAIARELVQAHGGSIRLQSTPGQGTTFTVEWPRRHH